MGDFNNILNLQEKIGGNRVHTTYMTQFSNFLNQANLISLPCSGNMYTWCNNQDSATCIYERLDHALANANWLQLHPNFELVNLPIHGSDHGPISLSLGPRKFNVNRIFRFEAMWLRHDSFSDLVTKVWHFVTSGSPIQKFTTHCSQFQYLTRQWNKSDIWRSFPKKLLLYILYFRMYN